MTIAEIVQKIQYMIAPAVMVSSSALLLLGFHNKFSNLANRFRVLNHEKRLLLQKENRGPSDTLRLDNLTQQIHELMKRAFYVKNAILCTYVAIMCFVGTSIFIFLNVYVSFRLDRAIGAVVVVGFLSLIATSLFMILETLLFFTGS